MHQSERKPLQKLTVLMPARDEAAHIKHTVEGLCRELRGNAIPFEVLVVVDRDTDDTWRVLLQVGKEIPELRPIHNTETAGFGRAVRFGLGQMTGDAVVIMMADGSDDCHDVVRYWQVLNKGFDCVFGSRFMHGGSATGYPRVKLLMNRAVNTVLRVLFRVAMNDITNAFKAYRREVIEGCRPLMSSQFELCVELPLTAIVRGYTWKVVPVRWRGRSAGASKLRIRAMAGPYLSTCIRIWKEAKRSKKGDMR